MTPQQEQQLRQQAKARGYTPEKIEQAVSFAKQKEAATQPQQAPKKNVGSVLKGFAKDAFQTLIVKPGTRIGQAAAYGMGAATGDEFLKEAAFQEQDVNLGPLGKYNIREVGAGKEGYKQAAGDALKSASYLYTPGKVVAGGSGILNAGLQGAKAGFVGGGAYGAGNALEQGKSTEDTLKDTTVGAMTGLVGGFVIGAGSKALITGFQGTRNLFEQVSQKIKTTATIADDSFIGRTMNRMKAASEQRAKLRSQPPVIQKAIHAEIPEDLADFVLSANPSNKRAFSDMLSIVERNQGKFKPSGRPEEITGKTFVNKVKQLSKSRSEVGKQIGKLMDSVKDDRIDVTNTYNRFLEDLNKAGVRRTTGMGLDFRKSSVVGSEKKLLEDIYKSLRPNAKGSALRRGQDINMIRQRIFKILDLGKKNNELTDFAQVIGNNARENLKMDFVSGTGEIGTQYGSLAQKYAQLEDTLDSAYKLLGRQWGRADDEVLNIRAGEVANRLLSNGSAQSLMVIEKLEKTLRDMGIKQTDNLVDQVMFSDALQKIFGSTQSTALQGRITNGIQDAAGVAEDLASVNPLKLAKRAVDYTSALTAPVEEKIRVLRELIKSFPKNRIPR